MKTLATAAIAVLLVSISAAAYADEVKPAWQEADFVMEEIVATAPANSQGLAWEEPGFVMEEIIVAANADDVAKSAQRTVSPHLRMLFAVLRHHRLQREFWPVASGPET